jgi:histidinol dehydrogenase
MGAVPARIAGVTEIVVATPAAPDGTVADVVLAAAALSGVTELHLMGGAHAVAALAYGSETMLPVDKIVGPGNAWVTAAKLAVYGDVAIDLPAGPSEALVLADGDAAPLLVAADLICQAEHGPDSPVVLVTTDPASVPAVLAEVDGLLETLERRDVIAKALTDHGVVVSAPDLEAAVAFANDYAPEHLTIHTSEPGTVADAITAAGSVFVGRWAPESAGDYATGANHVLPTGGMAAAHGPLSVEDFGSWMQVQTLTREGLAALLPTISSLAEAEGLTAHRLAAEVRFAPERPA